MRILTQSFGSALLVGLISWSAFGQVVRGVVVDQAAAPVPGVVVQLLDSASRNVARGLSNERGEFRVSAPRPGTYRLSTLRIGFRPTVSAAIVLPGGGEIEQRVTLSGVRVALDTMRVVGNNVCREFTDSGAATYRVWEQIRGAITATQITAASRAVSATTVGYERTMDPGGRRVLQQSSNIRSDYVTQPWLTMSPDSLHRLGYVVTLRDNSTVYYAPGLDMLVSPRFVEAHCFKLTTNRNRLGIAFEPVPDRRAIPEIRGTIWIDRASSQLERMEYRYVHLTPEQEDLAGGEMDFAPMKNGAWAVSRWSIRMPVLEQRVRSQAFGGNALRVAEVRVSGGELALARRGNDTLWSRPPVVLTASVADSASGSSIANAQVTLAGTQLTGTTDSRGRLTISGVLPGQYTLEVRTPSLDSVNAVHHSQLMFADASATVQIKVPTAQLIGVHLCGNKPLENPGMLLGTLAVKGDTVAPRNVRVFAEWKELSLRNAAGNAVTETHNRSLETRTDAAGNFRLCGVPVNTAMTLRPDPVAGDASPVEVRIPPNGRFARAELALERSSGAVLLGTVVGDSTQPLVGAEVTLSGLDKSAVSDERGRFRLSGIPAGTHQLSARRIGYGALDASVTFAIGQTLERQLVLPRAVALDSVIVRASERIPLFDEHRKLGLGEFLTREDLAKVEGRRLSDVLNTMRGVRVVTGKGANAWVSSRHRVGGGGYSAKTNPGNNVFPDPADSAMGAPAVQCYAQVYLDNMLVFNNRKTLEPPNPMAPGQPRQFRFDPLFNVNSIAPEQIEAIEYYSSPAEVPMRYSGSNSDCGVLVIHTRRRR